MTHQAPNGSRGRRLTSRLMTTAVAAAALGRRGAAAAQPTGGAVLEAGAAGSGAAGPGTAPPLPDPPPAPESAYDVLVWIAWLWNYAPFASGGKPITVGQMVIAVLIVLAGVLLARRVSRLVGLRLMRFRRVDANAAAFIQKILFYALVVMVGLFALQWAGIPITVFTIFGGAIAIGVGFGAQNLFNNVISGLIIMTERPIRLGDIVEVGDHQGRIEEIGNRCTRVRRFDGIDVLVPNSKFLEQDVINWTLHDNTLRGSVAVGVAYGSDTEAVRRLIRRAVDEHDKVDHHTEPTVLFEEFGDNALAFRVFFWTRITRPMDLRILESDLRYRIDALFREAGIVIAFPQRDLHLDTVRPLEVRLTRGGEARAGA